ncbi:hypothetical protein GA0074695_6152 [Micromonospora viridifaciens]|uniref:Uncharacterized protein n=1 Tax=Micromonospora viridifaciens TaxID=1881 RepID=A0A1C4ZUV2_MICVI|nr:hypothetical protein [Micromonospora viridifaciens]SCF36676.1 hypothetical protein GA0074695_6152 [Micromonospora viridifaciens]
MSPFLAVLLVLVLSSTCYAAGRLHGQLSYRIGYRFGYRQGYFDGDRGAWHRRRRDAQAVIASALAGPAPVPVATPATRATASFAGTAAPATRGAVPLTGTAAPATRATASFAGTAAPAAVTARPASGPAPARPVPRAIATAPPGGLDARQGTTYTGSSFSPSAGAPGGRQIGTLGTLVRRQG